MAGQLKLAEQPITRTTKAMAATIAALIILAFMPILLRVSETEISPNATVFNFSWTGTVFLVLWNGLLTLKSRGVCKLKTYRTIPL